MARFPDSMEVVISTKVALGSKWQMDANEQASEPLS